MTLASNRQGPEFTDLSAAVPVRDILRTKGVAGTRDWISVVYSGDPVRYERLALEFLQWLWRRDRRHAVAEAMELDSLTTAPFWDPRFRGMVRFELITRLLWLGEYRQAETLLRETPPEARARNSDLDNRSAECNELLQAHDVLALIRPASRDVQCVRSRRPRILYFVHHSLPFHCNGYALRTAALTAALRRRRFDVLVATRRGFPIDRELQAGAPQGPLPGRLDVNGIEHLFSPSARENLVRLPPVSYLRAAAARLAETIEREGIDLVHAASNYVCGLPAVAAAQACSIPAVYEARGAWEVTRASRDPAYADSDAYTLDRRLEGIAAATADRFLAINRPLGERYASRPFSVVPNGVATELRPLPARQRTYARGELGLPTDAMVLGYVGSIVDYEGLDLLVQALARLGGQRGRRVHALIIGDGLARPFLENMVRQLGLSGSIRFTGYVERARLPQLFAAMDAVCLPRRAWPVCELVTPLKPFEAMAMGVPVVVSSVAPLADAVRATGGGIVFEKENLDALEAAIRSFMVEPERLRKIGQKACSQVRRDWSWDAVVEPVEATYAELLGRSAGQR